MTTAAYRAIPVDQRPDVLVSTPTGLWPGEVDAERTDLVRGPEQHVTYVDRSEGWPAKRAAWFPVGDVIADGTDYTPAGWEA